MSVTVHWDVNDGLGPWILVSPKQEILESPAVSPQPCR